MQDDVPRLLARTLAALVALLLALEASGLAFALDAGPVIECCCGEHALEHPCDCPDCPGRKHSLSVSSAESGMSSHLWSCQRTGRDRILPSVPMLPPAELPMLAPPSPPGEAIHFVLAALGDRLPGVERPPP